MPDHVRMVTGTRLASATRKVLALKLVREDEKGNREPGRGGQRADEAQDRVQPVAGDLPPADSDARQESRDPADEVADSQQAEEWSRLSLSFGKSWK